MTRNGLLARCPVCGATELAECGDGNFVCEVCGSDLAKEELEFTNTSCAANIPENEIHEPDIFGMMSASETISCITGRFFYE